MRCNVTVNSTEATAPRWSFSHSIIYDKYAKCLDVTRREFLGLLNRITRCRTNRAFCNVRCPGSSVIPTWNPENVAELQRVNRKRNASVHCGYVSRNQVAYSFAYINYSVYVASSVESFEICKGPKEILGMLEQPLWPMRILFVREKVAVESTAIRLRLDTRPVNQVANSIGYRGILLEYQVRGTPTRGVAARDE